MISKENLRNWLIIDKASIKAKNPNQVDLFDNIMQDFENMSSLEEVRSFKDRYEHYFSVLTQTAIQTFISDIVLSKFKKSVNTIRAINCFKKL